MKFINKTKNSVQLDDVNFSIPYNDDQPQEIDTQIVKKSFAFQQMVSLGGFEVVEASFDRLEQNLLRLSKEFKQTEEQDVPRKPSGSNVEVLFRGHFYESTGYAKVNRNLVMNLARQGCLVEIDPLTTANNDLNEVEARVMSMLRKPVGKDAIFIDSVIPTHSKIKNQSYNIIYTTTETSTISKQFIDTINKYDEVWTVSNFCKTSFEESGINKNISVIPPIINKFLYHENVIPYDFRPKTKSFVFTSVLSWGFRKGSDVLIKSFCNAFSDKDDVSLVLLITEKSPARRLKIKEEIEKIKNEFLYPPQIFLYMKSIPEYLMPSFYKACNVFVLPSRGEGFGIPFCEASLCGLPVISTKYGGQLDFLSDDNSLLVDIDNIIKVETGKTNIHYWDNRLFPDLTTSGFMENLSQAMIDYYNNYELAKKKNKLLQSKILELFDGTMIGNKAFRIVDDYWRNKRNKL